MKDIKDIVLLLKQQKKELESLLDRSKGTYDKRKIELLEAEIEGLDFRIAKNEKLLART